MNETDRPRSTRDAVRRAAALVFLERGYTDTSIQEIADRLGIPKGSAYHHVQSKEQFLYEVLTGGMEDLLGRLEAIVEYPLSAADRLRLAMWDSVKASFDDTQPATGMALHSDIRFLSDEHRLAYLALRDRYQALLVDLVEEGIQDGEFRPIENPKMIVFAILGMLANVRRWFKLEGPLSLQTVTGFWWDLIFNGLHPQHACEDFDVVARPS